jgi:2',3'-cyclic-nucleotide 2'-phosphodiesterase/3'-nucleotidase
MSSFDVDPRIEERIADLQAQTQVWLDQPLGRISDYDLRIYDALDARVHKHPLVSFINQVQLAKSGAQISATALFNQPYGLNPEVTYRDLVSTYIYPNSLVVKRMSGKQMKDYLEQCAEYFCIQDGKLAVNPEFDEPKPQHFNYDMLDGIEYCLDISKPVGQRVKYCHYQGVDIGHKDSFTVVMNNYRAVGGGNFAMMRECETVHEITEDMVEILAEYISDKKDVHIEHRDNILITAYDIP